MKKVIALLMVCGFAVAFVACGGKKEETSTDTTTPAADTTATVATDTTKTDSTAAK